MDEFFAWLMGIFVGVLIGLVWAYQDVKKDAFERGYMVECVGKYGYYWECDE